MQRLEVLKTYKIYIGGKFPRTESGRTYPLTNKKGETIANMCLSSRKDFRNAVVEARKAFSGWANSTAYLKSQIIYRIAEMLEGRKAQFIDELMLLGMTNANAKQEVELSIDRLIYFSGWADKIQQISSSVNPVASSHFNFSVIEPTGVVAVFAPEESPLLGLITSIIPALVSGNTVVVLASETLALCAVSFAEVLNSSDVPGGVVNILTGNRKELIEHFSTHMDVNALLYCGNDKSQIQLIKENSVSNLKRIVIKDIKNWTNESLENPYLITDFTEVKTTWHPIEKIGSAGSGY